MGNPIFGGCPYQTEDGFNDRNRFPHGHMFVGEIENGKRYPLGTYTKEESDQRYAPKSVVSDVASIETELDSKAPIAAITAIETEVDNVRDELDNKADKDDIAYITPQMFGAVGDGETDDTDALTATIEYAAENNKNIYIPAGTYYISNSLSIPSKMSIIGHNMNDTIIKSDNTVFQIEGSRYVRLQNLLLQGSDNSGVGLSLTGSTVHLCSFKNLMIYGFATGISANTVMWNCVFESIRIGECALGGSFTSNAISFNNTFINFYIDRCDSMMTMAALSASFIGCNFSINGTMQLSSNSDIVFQECNFECDSKIDTTSVISISSRSAAFINCKFISNFTSTSHFFRLYDGVQSILFIGGFYRSLSGNEMPESNFWDKTYFRTVKAGGINFLTYSNVPRPSNLYAHQNIYWKDTGENKFVQYGGSNIPVDLPKGAILFSNDRNKICYYNGTSIIDIDSEPYVTLEMFGGKGDGTTDDSEAFAAALAFCQTNKTNILLLNKTYYLASEVSLISNVKIKGAGVGKTILLADENAFYMLNKSNVSIEGVTINKNDTESDEEFAGFSLDNTISVSINDTVINGFDTGINISNGATTLIVRGTVIKSCKLSLKVTSSTPCYGIEFDHVHFTECERVFTFNKVIGRFSGCIFDIEASASSAFTIADNSNITFEQCNFAAPETTPEQSTTVIRVSSKVARFVQCDFYANYETDTHYFELYDNVQNIQFIDCKYYPLTGNQMVDASFWNKEHFRATNAGAIEFAGNCDMPRPTGLYSHQHIYIKDSANNKPVTFSGSNIPVSLPTGMLLYSLDINKMCFYNGTNIVTVDGETVVV